ncbi:zinc transporter [Spiribacter vilamensis]|nr:zinc transporter [Spiribacter vilamensis]
MVTALAAPVSAAPQVATDIAPVHSLVSRVMDGVGEPSLVIQPGASPHNYSLRPSEAGALESADVVFWVGDELTPWLTGALDNLAGDARQVALLHTEGTERYAFRDRVLAEAGGHDDHGHESHSDDGHDDHGDHGEEGHNDGRIDPHAWLDPANARHWAGLIAETLAAEDPANADQYRENAEAVRADINDMMGDIRAAVEPVSDVPFVVFHDAYQYFERRFGMNTVGAISLSDASDPSPAHIAEIRTVVDRHDVQCVFAEPQFNPQLVETVLGGTDARTGVLDPLGSDIAVGDEFYATLINQLGERLVSCLEGS